MEGQADTTAHRQAERIARIAWLFAFVVPLILAAALLGVKSTHAAPPPGLTPLALEEELEDEGEEEESEAELAEIECAVAEEEAEEGEIAPAEARQTCAEAEAVSTGSSGGCPLRSAHARAVERHGRLKVTVGYTASESTSATVEVTAGSRRLAAVHRRLGHSGVLRIAKQLGRRRVNRIVVRFRTPSCAKFQTRPVTVG